MVQDRFTIFDVKSMNEELESEFHNFFHKYNLTPLFTDEHRTSPITVSDNDLRAVLNEGGAYHQTLKEFANMLNTSTDNQTYNEIIFKIIHKPRGFQGLMNNIKKVMEYIESIDPAHLYNKWNIVYYKKDLI